MGGNKVATASIALLALLVALSVPALAIAQEPAPPAQELEKTFPKKPPYSPYAGRHFPERVYWGDTHLHTSFSMDAGAFGCRLGPETLTALPKARRSPLPAASLPGLRAPWISSS